MVIRASAPQGESRRLKFATKAPCHPRRRSVPVLWMVAAMMLVGSAFEIMASEDAQLREDVDVINAVIERYENAGGWFSERDNAQRVLSRLAIAEGDYGLPFLGGSKGVRLVPVMAREAPQSSKWAYWNHANNRFQVWRGTAPPDVQVILKFKRSFRGGALAASASRDPNPSQESYAPRRSRRPARPTGLKAMSSTSDTIAQRKAPNSAPRDDLPALDAPLFDPPAGIYPIESFALSVRLLAAGLPEGAKLFYATGGSPWKPYGADPIEVAPGDEIMAFASAAGLDGLRDSDPVAARFLTKPVRPKLRLDTPTPELHRSAFTPGSERPELFPSVVLVNDSEMPPVGSGEPLYDVVWTLDGSDPLTSETAFPIVAVDGGVDDHRLPLQVATLLGEVNRLKIRAVLRSKKPSLLLNSEEVSCELRVAE